MEYKQIHDDLILNKGLSMPFREGFREVLRLLDKEEMTNWMAHYVKCTNAMQRAQDKMGEVVSQVAQEVIDGKSFNHPYAMEIREYFREMTGKRITDKQRKVADVRIVGEAWGADWLEAITMSK